MRDDLPSSADSSCTLIFIESATEKSKTNKIVKIFITAKIIINYFLFSALYSITNLWKLEVTLTF